MKKNIQLPELGMGALRIRHLTFTLGRDRRNQRPTSKWNTPDRKYLLQHHKNNNQFKGLLPFHYNITQANLNWVKLSQDLRRSGRKLRILRENSDMIKSRSWSSFCFPNLTSLCHWINWRLSGLSFRMFSKYFILVSVFGFLGGLRCWDCLRLCVYLSQNNNLDHSNKC